MSASPASPTRTGQVPTFAAPRRQISPGLGRIDRETNSPSRRHQDRVRRDKRSEQGIVAVVRGGLFERRLVPTRTLNSKQAAGDLLGRDLDRAVDRFLLADDSSRASPAWAAHDVLLAPGGNEKLRICGSRDGGRPAACLVTHSTSRSTASCQIEGEPIRRSPIGRPVMARTRPDLELKEPDAHAREPTSFVPSTRHSVCETQGSVPPAVAVRPGIEPAERPALAVLHRGAIGIEEVALVEDGVAISSIVGWFMASRSPRLARAGAPAPAPRSGIPRRLL